MRNRLTAHQRREILAMLQAGNDRYVIASALRISPGQVSAVAAHKTMGRYVNQVGTGAREVDTGKVVPIKRRDSGQQIFPGNAMNDSILLGSDTIGGESVFWNPQPQHGSANPHVLIIGESGYGKTYATSCLVAELVQAGFPSVIFDYGQGFSKSNTPEAFLRWANPVEFELSRDGIGINPLQIYPIDLHGPATVAQRIADTFARVYPRIGVQQHAVIRRAVIELLKDSGIRQLDRNTWDAKPPHFRNLERKLNEYAADSAASYRRTALSAASHISTLFVFDTFRSTGQKLGWQDLLRKRDQVWVLQLGGLEPSVEKAVTEFLLWSLIRFVEATGPGDLRCFVELDEAHKMSFVSGSPVEKLLREGRKFGLGVVLASQQPTDFSPVAFANTATKIVFQVADEKGMISRQLHRKTKNTQSLAQIYEVITKLPRGTAYVVTENVGSVVEIANFDERVSRWTNKQIGRDAGN